MKIYSQQDKQWEGDYMGGDGTLGDYGCLVTCMAMACTAYGYDETPRTLNRKLKQVGGYVGNFVVVRQVAQAVTGMRQVAFWQCPDDPAPIADIDYQMGAGNQVIVEIDYSRTEPGVQNHWVLLVEKAGEDYRIVDPWPVVDQERLLLDVAAGKDAGEAIRNVYVLAGETLTPGPSPLQGEGSEDLTPEAHAENATGSVMVVAPFGCNVRTAPRLGNNLVASLPPGTKIDLVEGVEPVMGEGIEWVAVQMWMARKDGEGTILLQ